MLVVGRPLAEKKMSFRSPSPPSALCLQHSPSLSHIFLTLLKVSVGFNHGISMPQTHSKPLEEIGLLLLELFPLFSPPFVFAPSSPTPFSVRSSNHSSRCEKVPMQALASRRSSQIMNSRVRLLVLSWTPPDARRLCPDRAQNRLLC